MVAARIQLKSGQLCLSYIYIKSGHSHFAPVSLRFVIYVCIVAPKVCKLLNSRSVMFQHERPNALFRSSSPFPLSTPSLSLHGPRKEKRTSRSQWLSPSFFFVSTSFGYWRLAYVNGMASLTSGMDYGFWLPIESDISGCYCYVFFFFLSFICLS